MRHILNYFSNYLPFLAWKDRVTKKSILSLVGFEKVKLIFSKKLK
ncbi:MAG: hypothetical protein PHH06_02500 [Candidatus Gracilibacteria bacterium]|nr:hypothetical protein [Candidatus Gracilibacteria bacterium]